MIKMADELWWSERQQYGALELAARPIQTMKNAISSFINLMRRRRRFQNLSNEEAANLVEKVDAFFTINKIPKYLEDDDSKWILFCVLQEEFDIQDKKKNKVIFDELIKTTHEKAVRAWFMGTFMQYTDEDQDKKIEAILDRLEPCSLRAIAKRTELIEAYNEMKRSPNNNRYKQLAKEVHPDKLKDPCNGVQTAFQELKQLKEKKGRKASANGELESRVAGLITLVEKIEDASSIHSSSGQESDASSTRSSSGKESDASSTRSSSGKESDTSTQQVSPAESWTDKQKRSLLSLKHDESNFNVGTGIFLVKDLDELGIHPLEVALGAKVGSGTWNAVYDIKNRKDLVFRISKSKKPQPELEQELKYVTEYSSKEKNFTHPHIYFGEVIVDSTETSENNSILVLIMEKGIPLDKYKKCSVEHWEALLPKLQECFMGDLKFPNMIFNTKRQMIQLIDLDEKFTECEQLKNLGEVQLCLCWINEKIDNPRSFSVDDFVSIPREKENPTTTTLKDFLITKISNEKDQINKQFQAVFQFREDNYYTENINKIYNILHYYEHEKNKFYSFGSNLGIEWDEIFKS